MGSPAGTSDHVPDADAFDVDAYNGSDASDPRAMDAESSLRASPPHSPRPTVEDVSEDEEDDMDGPGIPFDDDPTFHSEPYLPEEPTPEARLRELILAQKFVEGVENATLATDFIDAATLERLRHPPEGMLDLHTDENYILRLSLDTYASLDNASGAQYDRFRDTVLRQQHIHLLTYEQVKARAAELSGVLPILVDMCPNSCLAYTGPYADCIRCPKCHEGK